MVVGEGQAESGNSPALHTLMACLTLAEQQGNLSQIPMPPNAGSTDILHICRMFHLR